MIEGEEEYEVESIRVVRRKGRSKKREYLMHWKGYPASDDSWVSQDDLNTPELLEEFRTQSAAAGRPDV
jgi:hypothetical protein